MSFAGREAFYGFWVMGIWKVIFYYHIDYYMKSWTSHRGTRSHLLLICAVCSDEARGGGGGWQSNVTENQFSLQSSSTVKLTPPILQNTLPCSCTIIATAFIHGTHGAPGCVSDTQQTQKGERQLVKNTLLYRELGGILHRALMTFSCMFCLTNGVTLHLVPVGVKPACPGPCQGVAALGAPTH